MKRECLVCHKNLGEVGDKKNGSVTSGICKTCLLAIEEYRYYRRMYQITGFQLFRDLRNDRWNKLKEREENGKSNSG